MVRYCHIGTGNYNSRTARIYEDCGLLTADPEIGADLQLRDLGDVPIQEQPADHAAIADAAAEAARRGVPDAQRLQHLRLPSSLADPFKRLVDSGLRLNQLRNEAALHDFLIDELTELSGAERVLLVQGSGFNWPHPDHFRLVFLPHEDDLRDAIGRVARFLENYRKRHGT